MSHIAAGAAAPRRGDRTPKQSYTQQFHHHTTAPATGSHWDHGRAHTTTKHHARYTTKINSAEWEAKDGRDYKKVG